MYQYTLCSFSFLADYQKVIIVLITRSECQEGHCLYFAVTIYKLDLNKKKSNQLLAVTVSKDYTSMYPH